MKTFKQRIIEKPDHTVRMSDGRAYAMKQIGNKVRTFMKPDGTTGYTRGGVTFVRLN